MRHLLLLLLCLLAPAWGATTTSTTFAAVGNGTTIQILPNAVAAQTGSYSITGTFVGTLVWQYSPDQNNWNVLQTYTTTQGATVFAQPGYYRWACSAYTSGSPVGVIVVQPFIFQQINDFGGNLLFQVDTSGTTAVTPSPAVIPPGNQEAAYYQGNVNNFFELQVQNANAGSSASSDFVATANDGTASTHYVDLGINGSTGGVAPFTAAHGAYIYSSDNLLDVGAVGATGTVNIDVGATPTVVLNVDYANGVSINDVTTPTKQIRFLPSGATASTILTLSETQSTSQTLSVPNITGADTIETLGLAQTITGAKTLSAITTVSNATASTTTGTGALVVTGGEGVGGAITGGSTITGTQLISNVATGTAPLAVTSTTNVPNLNASTLSGSTFASPGAIGGGSAAAANFTTVGTTGNITTTATAASTWTNTTNSGFSAIVANAASGSSGIFQISAAATGLYSLSGTATNLQFKDIVNSTTWLTYTPGALTASTEAHAGTLAAASGGTGSATYAGGIFVTKTSFLAGPTTIGAATVPSANTFAGNTIWGRNTAAADTAGAVGETITGTFSAVAAGLTTATGNVGSVSLTAGKWLVSGKVVISSGATGLTALSNIQVSCPVTTAGTGTSGTTMAQQCVPALVAAGLWAVSVDAQVVNISATTSEFLTCNITYAAGSPTFAGSITAVRLP